jgi:hypothetical protein
MTTPDVYTAARRMLEVLRRPSAGFSRLVVERVYRPRKRAAGRAD